MGEEQLVTGLLLSLLAEACGLEDISESELLPGEHITTKDFPAASLYEECEKESIDESRPR